MFDNLSVLVEAEDIDPGVVLVTRPLLVAMEDHYGRSCAGR